MIEEHSAWFMGDIRQLKESKDKGFISEDNWKFSHNLIVRKNNIYKHFGISSNKVDDYKLIQIFKTEFDTFVIGDDEFGSSEPIIELENALFGRSYVLIYFRVFLKSDLITTIYTRMYLGSDGFSLDLPRKTYESWAHEYYYNSGEYKVRLKNTLRKYEFFIEETEQFRFMSYKIKGYEFFVKRAYVHIRLIHIEFYKKLESKRSYIKAQKQIKQAGWRTLNDEKGNLINKPKNQLKQRNTYIMLDEHTGYYKIGYSANPVKRESTLLSMKPTIKLLYVCRKFVEPELHKKYSEYRIRGEWFNLKDQHIDEILSEYKFKQHELSNRHIS